MQKFSNETEFIFSNEFIGFTTIPNHILNDKRISYKALGIYVQILQFQNSPTHKIYIKSLSQLKKDGRDSVTTGIKELLNTGYLSRELLQDKAGRMNGYRYTVYMQPCKACKTNVHTVNGKSGNGKHGNGKAVNGTSDDGESGTYNTIGNNTMSNNTIGNQSVGRSEIEGMTEFREKIEKQVDLETLLQGNCKDMAEELISNICDMYFQKSIRVGQQNVPQSLVRANIARLKHYHLEHVLTQYNAISEVEIIRNVKSYLQSCIYNSVFEANSKIQNDIRAKGLV